MIKGVFDSIFAVGALMSNSLNYFYQDPKTTLVTTQMNESESSENKMHSEDETLHILKRRKAQHQDLNNNTFSQSIDWQGLRQDQNVEKKQFHNIGKEEIDENEEVLVVFISKDAITPFQQFLNRMQNAKELYNARLNKLISKEDLLKIFDYFLIEKKQSFSWSYLTRSHTDRHYHIEKIKQLKPGESYRLAKEDSHLPRTINILCDKSGEFKLILETKSKLHNGKKQSLPKVGGSFKSGKPAWKIDGAYTEYFNLVVEFEKESELNEVKKEVEISQQLACDTVNKNELGQEFKKHGKRKISVYSEKAQGSLEDLLTDKVKFTPEQKHILIQDLLDGVAHFHDNDLVHQDLKPANVLFIKNEKNQYRLKITDYGLTRKQHEQNEQALATSGYHSPEIALIHADKKSEYFKYYNCTEAKNTLGAWYAKSNQPAKDPNFATPHNANDTWALGIMIYEILHGRKPYLSSNNPNINNDPLLKGLLARDRAQRIDLKTAKQIHSQTPINGEQASPSQECKKRKFGV